MLPADLAFFTRTFAGYLLPQDADLLAQVMYFETTVNLPGDMLVKVDRMSMANSLEVRCPLLDQEVAEIAAAAPHDWKIRNGKGKQFLIEGLGDRLPPELLDRPKMGFGVPIANWFRGPLRPMLWDHLTSRRFLDRGLVSRDFLLHLLKEHDAGRRDNNYWLWPLLMLELWFRELEDAKAIDMRAAGVVS
jgi:asparagine synthase (glutamine-hydrolysing)